MHCTQYEWYVVLLSKSGSLGNEIAPYVRNRSSQKLNHDSQLFLHMATMALLRTLCPFQEELLDG